MRAARAIDQGVGSAVLVIPDGNILEHVTCLAFPATDDVVDYETVVVWSSMGRGRRAVHVALHGEC